MSSIPLSDNDPVIDTALGVPDKLTLPTGGPGSANIFNASITLQDTSHLPLQSSTVKVTLDNSLDGYEVELLNSSHGRTDLLTLHTGALQPGDRVSKSFQFRIRQVFGNVPTQPSGAGVIFHVMPSYEIKYNPRSNGYISQTNISVAADQSSPGAVGGWVSSPPWQSQPSTPDPIIDITQHYWQNCYVPLAGWDGYAAATVKLTNKSVVPISFLKFQVDVDDVLSNYNLKCMDNDHSWASFLISDDVAPINPNEQVTYNYWMTVSHISGADESPATGTGTLAVAPWYKVEYRRSDSLNTKVPVSGS